MPELELFTYESLNSGELTKRIQRVRKEMGPGLLILGHHYQRDEVIELANVSSQCCGRQRIVSRQSSPGN